MNTATVRDDVIETTEVLSDTAVLVEKKLSWKKIAAIGVISGLVAAGTYRFVTALRNGELEEAAEVIEDAAAALA